MTVKDARDIFARLMALARQRSLTDSERTRLRQASQAIRYAKRSTAKHNSAKPRRNPLTTWTIRATTKKAALAAVAKEMAGTWYQVRSVKKTGPDTYLVTVDTMEKRNVTRKKARRILHEGQVRGRPLTAAQRGMFGARASGYPPRKNPGGLVRMGKLVELRYYRDHGRSPGFYKHPFTTRPTLYYDPRTNSIIAKGGK